jgi:subtilase family serine protease
MHMNRTHHRPHGSRLPRRRPRRWPWLAAAPLTACLTAACASAAIGGTTASSPTPQLNCGVEKGAPASCYSPQEYEVAYGVAPLLRRGIDGRGETVALPELAQTPSNASATDIRKDLAAFDSKFGLPPASLRVVNTIARSATPYLAGNQELGDTEMVHAFAPGATLDIVLVPAGATTSPASFAAAVTKAVQESTALHAAVVSVSVSVGEHFLTRAAASAMNQALEQARDQHITLVASSGARGAISSHPAGPPVQVSLPASDPLVLAVGGTRLDATPDGTYLGETAWNDNLGASGGGYSSLFPRPAYQDGLARARATRGVPDVAANADSNGAMAIEYGNGELRSDTGTSSATALWAGVIALADQQAGHPLGFVNPALYAIAQDPAYHQAFHDVITGNNSVIWHGSVFTGYTAGPGWDPVTGWGSPDAQYLVPLLAHTGRSGT